MKLALFSLFSLFVFFSASGVAAEPEVQAEYQYYPIRGKGAEELNRIIKGRGLGTDKWEKFSAYARWDVQWYYKYNRGSDHCSIAAVTTKVRIAYYMPKWVNPAGADQNTRLKWEGFAKALATHEEGHGEHGILAAREIEEFILQLPPQKTCGELSLLCDELAKSIIQKYREQDVKYDEETNHGLTQGVVFF